MRSCRAATVLIPVLLACLAACGGGANAPPEEIAAGGGSGGGSGSSQGATLALTTGGLPDAAAGVLRISGPAGFSETIASSVTSLAVPAGGHYTVTAQSVLTGTRVLAPTIPAQGVDVAEGATAPITIIYQDQGPLSLALQPVQTGLGAPLFATAPAGDSRLFIVLRNGNIRIVSGGQLLATPFLSIPTRISTTGEGGLLSMAFDPDYGSNGFFYVYLTDPTGDVAIERYQVSAGDPNLADPTPLRLYTATHRSFSNHKGGLLAFGPDGMLYAAPGDGGSANDPFGNGQNLSTPLGKLLRLDVRNATAQAPYAIPADNPFVGQAGALPEIWAYGLRNPWRFAFDPADSRLYIADVGQNRREEVNAVAATAPGINYGWKITEGTLCFQPDPCSTTGITLPVIDYAHDVSGGCSIAGGFVYRGSAIPELRGRYFYSDFCSGWLRSFTMAGQTAVEPIQWPITSVGQVYSFGQDAQGELYVLATSGTVYRIVRQ